jgi:hypothetical protein
MIRQPVRAFEQVGDHCGGRSANRSAVLGTPGYSSRPFQAQQSQAGATSGLVREPRDLHGMQEVRGSTPLSSTFPHPWGPSLSRARGDLARWPAAVGLGWVPCSAGFPRSCRISCRRAGRGSSWSARSRAAARTNELDAGKRRPIIEGEEEPLTRGRPGLGVWWLVPRRCVAWRSGSHIHPFGACR